MSEELPNVFAAFASGRAEGSATANAFASPLPRQQPGPLDGQTVNLVAVLRTLADDPRGRTPFSALARQLPGDPVSKLSATVGLMKEGWLEFVGDIGENGDVRITEAGRRVVETLQGAIEAA